MKVVILPGMGCTPVATSNWYSWLHHELQKQSIECILRDFPDPYECKESIWMPFVLHDIGIDASTIVVGHSTGAACAMRLMEQQQVHGVILVAAAYTDMGLPEEIHSEYFNRPWQWDRMKDHTQSIVLFHGTDDHLIPVQEARYIAAQLKGHHFQYIEMPNRSHFFEPWPEILDVLQQMITANRAN
jgi:uncharacterized protein